MMMGRGCEDCEACCESCEGCEVISGPARSISRRCGEGVAEGPLGEAPRERRRAGVDREAALARARARSGSCIKVVRRDRREVRLGCESTLRNMPLLSSVDELPLSPTSSSSQSDESSSSSITLSNASSSSSSSDSSNTGLSVMALS